MKKDNGNKFILIGVVIIIILFIIVCYLEVKERELDYSQLTEDEVNLAIQQEIEDIHVNELSKLEENDRIEQYVSRFMEKVDNEEYEAAYEMLYEDFKTNYFPTLESFTKYAQEKFPKLMSLEHTNFERNGNIYVLWVNVYDLMKSKSEGVEMNFVIRENALNDFELSFSAN